MEYQVASMHCLADGVRVSQVSSEQFDAGPTLCLGETQQTWIRPAAVMDKCADGCSALPQPFGQVDAVESPRTCY